jgi:O-antigen ligase
LGNAVAISIPTTVALLFVTGSRWARAGLLIGVLLASVALMLALDRTSWIGVVLGLVVMILLLPRTLRARAGERILAGVVVIAVLGLVIGGSATSAKLSSIFDPTSVQGASQQEKGIAQGEQDRLQYWGIALHDGFLDHPLAGVGIGDGGQLILDHSTSAGAGVKGGTGQFANVASTYLQLLAEAGLCGLALLIVFFSALVADARAAVRTHPVIAAGLAGAAMVMLVCWVTDVVVYYESVAACEGVLLGAIAGAASARGPRPARGLRLTAVDGASP